MRRTTFSFADMIRTIATVAAVFAMFVTAVHVSNNGLATPAFASAASAEVGVVQKKSNGVGFVLMVSLQRAG